MKEGRKGGNSRVKKDKDMGITKNNKKVRMKAEFSTAHNLP